jgi:hypothetical protein
MSVDLNYLITEIEAQKALMISVATGGPRIKEVNEDYVNRRSSIKMELSHFGMQHRRTAGFRDAALYAEATRALINISAIISGKRDPFEG